MPAPSVAARLDKKREKSEVKARIGAGRRRLAGLCEDESVAVFLVKIDAIDAAPEWSLLMLLEQRDDGRVAVFLRDGQRREW